MPEWIFTREWQIVMYMYICSSALQVSRLKGVTACLQIESCAILFLACFCIDFLKLSFIEEKGKGL